MEKSQEDMIKNMLCTITELPEESQKGLLGILENFPFVLELCKNSDLTEEEIEQYMERAVQAKDYTLLALLCAVQAYRKEVKVGKIPKETAK